MEVVLNGAGIRELLKDPAVSEMCQQYASQVLAGCGDGYEMQPRNYPERSGMAVVAVTYQAKKDAANNQTLLKALGGVG